MGNAEFSYLPKTATSKDKCKMVEQMVLDYSKTKERIIIIKVVSKTIFRMDKGSKCINKPSTKGYLCKASNLKEYWNFPPKFIMDNFRIINFMESDA
jgi:hypothetical protein